MIKFSKEGQFVTADDDEPVEETAEFVALCDQTLIGWIKFHPEDDVPPERVQGLLYDGFVMPARDTLGDLDPSRWTEGLSGQPEDPWRHPSAHRHRRAFLLSSRQVSQVAARWEICCAITIVCRGSIPASSRL
jgi:hypothetical protein